MPLLALLMKVYPMTPNQFSDFMYHPPHLVPSPSVPPGLVNEIVF